MSYDVDLKEKDTGRQIDYSWMPHTNGGYINITYNLADMFRALPVGLTPSEWDGKVAGDLIQPISKSLRELYDYPGKYRKYESPNGWGTITGMINFLTECITLFAVYPNAIVGEES